MPDCNMGVRHLCNIDAAPVIDYLRISITDRCNLRCTYCMPAEGVDSLSHEDILTYEELAVFARAAVECGVRRVRLTGGEPLVRKGAPDFVGMLTEIDPGLKVTMTTNGVLLARYAGELKEAGLTRVNVSLDTLDPLAYRDITRVGRLEDALAGLDAALEAGFEPVKVNVVVLKGLSDDPLPFARLAAEKPVHVRFIEYMPHFGEAGSLFVPGDVVRARLGDAGRLERVESPEGWGPAEYYRQPGAAGTLGFISPVTCHFCASCNRLRISSEGRLRTCLYDSRGVDVRSELRSGAGREGIREIISSELERKRLEGHSKPPAGTAGSGDHMSRIGG